VQVSREGAEWEIILSGFKRRASGRRRRDENREAEGKPMKV
jgi:hypothetical protein